MLFCEMQKNMVKKVTFVGFRGAIAPIAPFWIRPAFMVLPRDKICYLITWYFTVCWVNVEKLFPYLFDTM